MKEAKDASFLCLDLRVLVEVAGKERQRNHRKTKVQTQTRGGTFSEEGK